MSYKIVVEAETLIGLGRALESSKQRLDMELKGMQAVAEKATAQAEEAEEPVNTEEANDRKGAKEAKEKKDSKATNTKKATNAKKEEKPSEPEQVEEPTVTVDELRNMGRELMTAKKKDEFLAALKAVGADSITECPKEKYADLYAEFQKILNPESSDDEALL